MKLIRRVLLAVVLLVIIVAVFLYLRLDTLIKSTVETQASSSLKLNTSLNSAKLSLFGGKLNLNNLSIASPAGFKAPQMLDVGDTDLAVSYGQLRSQPIHVDSLAIKKPKLVIEQQNGVFNFKKAMDSIPAGDTSAPATQGEPLRLIIDTLTIQDPQVVVRPNLPGLAEEITVPIPSITMKDVGTGDGSKNGAAVKDVVMQVITAMAGSASSSSSLPDSLKGLLNINVGQTLGQLGGEAQKRIAAAIPGELGKSLSEAVKDPQALLKDPGKALQGLSGLVGDKKGAGATSQPSDIQNKATDALQNLLGGKKK